MNGRCTMLKSRAWDHNQKRCCGSVSSTCCESTNVEFNATSQVSMPPLGGAAGGTIVRTEDLLRFVRANDKVSQSKRQ